MKWILAAIGVAFLLALGSFFWAELRLKPMDEAARENAPGTFVSLPEGELHTRWSGPENGPLVVLVHGFSTPNFIFEQNVSALNAAGYRTLRYDHFGRGWSDRPKVDYTIDFYDRVLLGLLDDQGLTDPVSLIGLSMGGPIVAEFAARHPDRVNHVTLLVPAGLDLSSGSGGAARLLQVPGIGDWIWRLFGRGILLGDDQYQENTLATENRLAGDVSVQMEYRGYLGALLSTLRHMPLVGRDATYRRLAETGIPTLALYGDADMTVDVSSAEKLKTLMPAADIRIIAGGTHGLNYQRHAEINPILLNALTLPLASISADE